MHFAERLRVLVRYAGGRLVAPIGLDLARPPAQELFTERDQAPADGAALFRRHAVAPAVHETATPRKPRSWWSLSRPHHVAVALNAP